METPVPYFYATRETTVKVKVRFRKGVMTEWFPHATVTPGDGSTHFNSASTIAWQAEHVSPGAAEHFPIEHAASHYYAARRTEAAALRSDRAQKRKNSHSQAVRPG